MTWKEAILQLLRQEIGKQITLQDIYLKFSHHPLVTDQHVKPWRPGLQPKYHCWIRRYLSTLVNEGKIKRTKKATYQFIHS